MTTLASQIKRARVLAIKFHAGAKRRDSKPYWTHLKAVADAVNIHLRPVAWLHDVLENTTCTVADLAAAGIHQSVIDAVVAITKPKDQSYYDYIQRMENPMAVAVKIADIRHNMSDSPNEDRREKYPRALEVLVAKQKSLN